LLVAWAGGPRAQRLCGADSAEIARAAVASLRSLFGSQVEIERELAGAYVHDWQSDPCAFGAYSYAKVGAASARRALAEPIADTLYFAGEATHCEGEAATVAGALHSGVRAAREVLITA
jgi:monoamine oxidase